LFSLFVQIGEWIEDEEQTIRLKCNYVISAFGSTLNELAGLYFVIFLFLNHIDIVFFSLKKN